MNEAGNDFLTVAGELGVDVEDTEISDLLARIEITPEQAARIVERNRQNIHQAAAWGTLHVRRVPYGKRELMYIQPRDLIAWQAGKQRTEDRIVNTERAAEWRRKHP